MNVSLIMTAVQHGATVANYAEVTALHKKAANGKLCGARVRDVFTGEEFNVRAKVTIIDSRNESDPCSWEARS